MQVERDWNTWDDSPRTVTEHIEQYRQRLAKPPTPPTAVQETDFFTVINIHTSAFKLVYIDHLLSRS